MFKADDYRMRAKLLSDTLAETKEALDIDILREQLAQLKVEQEKPEVWQDLERSAKLGREIASVEGKVNATAALAIAATTVTAFARICDGHHYLSDVAVAMLISVAVQTAVIFAMYGKRLDRLQFERFLRPKAVAE